MIDYLGMVKQFHIKYRHWIEDDAGPTLPPQVIIDLRRKLISEEAIEFAEASELQDIEAIADALADLLYVVFGAALTYGIPIAEVFAEVHESNMTKSMAKDEKSIKGKTIKGPDYVPPNLHRILFKEVE